MLARLAFIAAGVDLLIVAALVWMILPGWSPGLVGLMPVVVAVAVINVGLLLITVNARDAARN